MIVNRIRLSTMTQRFADGDFTHLPSEKTELPLIEVLLAEGEAGEAGLQTSIELALRILNGQNALLAGTDRIGVHVEHEVRNIEAVTKFIPCRVKLIHTLIIVSVILGHQSLHFASQQLKEPLSVPKDFVSAVLLALWSLAGIDRVVRYESGAYFVCHAQSQVTLVEDSEPITIADTFSTLTTDIHQSPWCTSFVVSDVQWQRHDPIIRHAFEPLRHSVPFTSFDLFIKGTFIHQLISDGESREACNWVSPPLPFKNLLLMSSSIASRLISWEQPIAHWHVSRERLCSKYSPLLFPQPRLHWVEQLVMVCLDQLRPCQSRVKFVYIPSVVVDKVEGIHQVNQLSFDIHQRHRNRPSW